LLHKSQICSFGTAQDYGWNNFHLLQHLLQKAIAPHISFH